jgi:hypothetical protein
MLDLITQVRNLALEAELKGQKALAEKLRAVADEAEAVAKPEEADHYLARRLDAEGLPRGQWHEHRQAGAWLLFCCPVSSS